MSIVKFIMNILKRIWNWLFGKKGGLTTEKIGDALTKRLMPLISEKLTENLNCVVDPEMVVSDKSLHFMGSFVISNSEMDPATSASGLLALLDDRVSETLERLIVNVKEEIRGDDRLLMIKPKIRPLAKVGENSKFAITLDVKRAGTEFDQTWASVVPLEGETK